jgi:hypothetical protein
LGGWRRGLIADGPENGWRENIIKMSFIIAEDFPSKARIDLMARPEKYCQYFSINNK